MSQRLHRAASKKSISANDLGIDNDEGKGKGRKGKGKKINDEDFMDVPAGIGRSIDYEVQSAIISINRLDILAPVLPLTFGTFNNRPLNERQATILHETMVNEEFAPFKFQNMIPLVLGRDAIDPKCLNATMHDLEAAPFLQLTPAGLAEGVIIAAGGRHRHRAVQLEQARLKDRVDILKKRIEEVKESNPKETDGMLERLKKLEKMEEHLALAEKRLDQVGIWGVIVFDAGECARHYRVEIY